MPVYKYLKKGKKNRGKKEEDIKTMETRYLFKCYYYDWFSKIRKAKLCRGKEYGYPDGFPTKKIAEAAERKFIIENEDNRNIKNRNSILFDDAVIKYLAYANINVKPQTYRAIESRIRLHITPYFKNKEIMDIRKSDINNWTDNLEITSNMKRNSLTKCRSALNSIFSYCNDYLDIEYNPLLLSKTFNRKQESNEVHIWNDQQFNNFIEYSKKCFKNNEKWCRFNLFCYFGFYLSCRPGESMALQFKDIDLENDLVSINSTVSIKKSINTGKEEAFDGKATKTEAGKRTNPLPTKIKELIIEYKKICENKYGYKDTWYILSGASISRYVVFSSNVDNIIKMYNDNNPTQMLPRVTPKGLRHSFASRMHELGLADAEIAALMGHTDLETTRKTYTHAMHTDKSVEFVKNQ